MIPVFAVVGRVNEGKSSIIATLTENDDIEVSPDPGTTKLCHRYVMERSGRRLFDVVDTPGFQEPEAALNWLKSRSSSSAAANRPRLVQEFVETFKGSDRFEDECYLLEPILNGAFIIYVADCSHPFRPGFEAELEILRWTGRPRMALLNRIEATDYLEDWRPTLNQYFSVVREFNAHKASRKDRREILLDLQVLDQTLRPALQSAVEVLQEVEEQRLDDSATYVVDLLADAAGLQLSLPFDGQVLSDHQKEKFLSAYRESMQSREQRCRDLIEKRYQFLNLAKEDDHLHSRIFEDDLFSKTVWEFLGLSKTQLIATATLTGATAGGVIDVALGGHSFFLGSILGGITGFGSAVYVSHSSPTHKLVGFQVAGPRVLVGPINNHNFGFIVLDRALLHFEALMGRTHAVRSKLLPTEQHDSDSGTAIKIGRSAHLPRDRRSIFLKAFINLGKGKKIERSRDDLFREVRKLLTDIAI